MPELTEFAGLPVVEFPDIGTDEERLEQIRRQGGDPKNAASAAWRLRTVSRYGGSSGDECEEHIARFLSLVESGQVRALIIGEWQSHFKDTSEELLNPLIEHADALPNLRLVYVGDLSARELELSWICHGDLAPFLAAFPRVEELVVKGADGLDGCLGLHVPSHASLRSLTLETGGLPGRVVREVASSGLPALEHLELWLGVEEYGGDTTPVDLEPVLSGKAFPGLRYLGVRNAERVDEWVSVLADAPVVQGLEVLDLSLGTLRDEGGRVLVERAEAFSGLGKLDLHHHYLSEEMEQRVRSVFEQAGVEVDLSDPQEAEDYGNGPEYYTAAAE